MHLIYIYMCIYIHFSYRHVNSKKKLFGVYSTPAKGNYVWVLAHKIGLVNLQILKRMDDEV